MSYPCQFQSLSAILTVNSDKEEVDVRDSVWILLDLLVIGDSSTSSSEGRFCSACNLQPATRW